MRDDGIESEDIGHHELQLLTPDQVCRLLQVRKSWIYDQVEAGRLPHLRLGNQLRFRRADLAEYLRRIAD